MVKKRWAGFLLILIGLLTSNNTQAQLLDALQNALKADTVVIVNDSDSIRMAIMENALRESQLNEMNLRMEMEQLRLQTVLQDSVKLAEQRQRIDSLRSITPGIPVVVDKDTLFFVFARKGGQTAISRAELTEQTLMKLGKKYNLQPDSVYVESTDILTEIMYDNVVIFSLTDQGRRSPGHIGREMARHHGIEVARP